MLPDVGLRTPRGRCQETKTHMSQCLDAVTRLIPQNQQRKEGRRVCYKVIDQYMECLHGNKAKLTEYRYAQTMNK